MGFESLASLTDAGPVSSTSLPDVTSTSTESEGSSATQAPSTSVQGTNEGPQPGDGGSTTTAVESGSSTASPSDGTSSGAATESSSGTLRDTSETGVSPTDTSAASDSSDAASSTPCDEFSAPEPALGLPDGLSKPSFTPDGLTVYFKIPGGDDFHTAVRANSEALDFGEVTSIEAVSLFDVFDLALSADGLSLYFAFVASSDPEDASVGMVMRETQSSNWSATRGPIQTNSPYRESAPWLRADGLELLFTSDRPTTLGGENIWVSSRSTAGDEFVDVLLLDTLSSDSDESDATLTADGLTVFFASNRPGGEGGADVWMSQRPGVTGVFGRPTHVSNVNSPSNDNDPVPSSDGQDIYFVSDRGGAAQLWRSRRTCN
jgi:hypothetical protein